MNNISHSFCTISLIWINFTLLIKAASAYDDDQVATVPFTQESSSTKFVPHHYARYYFFFLAADNSTMTVSDFERILDQLNKWDEYCGGETIEVVIYFSYYSFPPIGKFRTFNDVISSWCSGDNLNACYNQSIVLDTKPGRNDPDDVGNMSEMLIGKSAPLGNASYNNIVARQVILITNYVTDSLKNETTISKLLELKENGNVTFISLNMALSDSNNVSDYFSGNIWKSYTNYLQWYSSLYSIYMNDTFNPLCGYEMDHYTTPNPSYEVGLTLHIYLLLSREYVNCTKTDLIELFRNLAIRRWQYPCRQYRSISSTFYGPLKASVGNKFPFDQQVCYYEDNKLDVQNYCTPQTEDWNWFSDWIDKDANKATYISCQHYEALFQKFLSSAENSVTDKYLLITDLSMPMNCNFSANGIWNALKNYTDYASGAPLTAIAIDKENDRTVYNSFLPLFPPSQMPNLYNVTNISNFLQNIKKSIYFCLDAVPSPELYTIPSPSSIIPLPTSSTPPSFWYMYLIGAITLTAMVASMIVFIITRNKKRKLVLREMRIRLEMATATNIPMEINENNFTSPPIQVDIWEISLNSLHIDFIGTLGKGAFAVVHMGKLHGRAPVLDIYPSIALQNYIDCDVAVKTLPAYYKEAHTASFLNEIRLMKDIGYHIHLVSMLGCNCSIERPFLVLELADQSLLHWLIRNSTSETDIHLDKTLLSFSWQISDGMNYLSSKLFIHRDLAARNILLGKGSKAMVSDFGLCRKLDDAEQVLTIPGGKVPLKWMALESLLEHQFSIKTDVWSFGVLMYEIYSLGQEPYGIVSGEGLRKLLQEEKRLEQPKLANEEIYEVMKACWHVDPASRPTFATIKNVFEGMLEDSTENYGYLQATTNETD